MKKNVGNVDRVVRAIAGLALAAAGLVFAGSGLWWLAIVGGVLLATAAVRVCPLYLPLHIDTSGK